MTATYPGWLPYKAIAGSHEFEPMDNVAAFTPEVGDDIAMQLYTGYWETHKFQMAMTKAEKDGFFAFRRDDCGQGALAFLAPFVDGVIRTYAWVKDSPPSAVNIRGGSAYMITVTVKRKG